MIKAFPGLTVETSKLDVGASQTLFEGLFAAGGITLSQLCSLTGLEGYVIQNWIKRRFVAPPKGRMYGKEHLAVIALINLLRDTLQIERICSFVSFVQGVPNDKSDDLCGFEELYHGYVDLIADGFPAVDDPEAVKGAARLAAERMHASDPQTQKKLQKVYEVMLYAHAASLYRRVAEEKLSHMDI